MKAIIRNVFLIAICMGGMVAMTGCREKGCTNPSAINYNSAADEDDGSCIVCQSTYEEKGTLTAFMFDGFSGPHQNQTVAVFRVTQVGVTYNNSLCGTSNNDCQVIIKIESLVNETMHIFFYDLNCNSSFNSLNFHYEEPITVAGHQTITLDTLTSSTVSNVCADINASSLSVFLSSSISYQ